MNLENYINKIELVEIMEKLSNFYIGKIENTNLDVYIPDPDEDYMPEELLNQKEKCLIIDKKQNKLIGFLLTNRKFENDIKKIYKELNYDERELELKDIYLLKRLKLAGKIVGLYIVDELKNGKIYLGTKQIGTYSKEHEGMINIKENTIENGILGQIKDIIQSDDMNKKEISLRQEQEKEKKRIEKILDLEEGYEITRIATVKLKEKVNGKEQNEQELKNKQNENQINLTKEKMIEQHNKEKNVNIKQQLETRDKLTDMKTLGQVLEKEGKLPKVRGKEFERIGIIESTQRDNLLDVNAKRAKLNTTRYSLVAIAKDGTTVPLDIEQDHQDGYSPAKQNYQVSHNGEVKQDTVLSRFEIGDGSISIKNGQYGRIQVYHSPRKTIGDRDVKANMSLDRELETDNVYQMRKEERDLAEEYTDGYRSVEEGYEEAKVHENEKGEIKEGEKMTTKDIDGERDTCSHEHDINVNYSALATKWGYYKEGEPNANRAKEILEEKRKENPQKKTNELIEMVTEELEEEMGPQHRER